MLGLVGWSEKDQPGRARAGVGRKEIRQLCASHALCEKAAAQFGHQSCFVVVECSCASMQDYAAADLLGFPEHSTQLVALGVTGWCKKFTVSFADHGLPCGDAAENPDRYRQCSEIGELVDVVVKVF